MPLSAAERQRRYKEKLKRNPAKYEDYKRKKRDNYHAKKRLVKDLTPKERHHARIIWKLRKQNLRKNRKRLNRLLDITPPSSPSILVPEANQPQNAVVNSPQQNNNVDDDTDIGGISTPQSSHATDRNVSHKNKGRIKVRRDRSKLYRENLRLQQEIADLKKKYEKYKKRFIMTQKETRENKQEKGKSDDTTKYKKLSNAIKEKYQTTKKHKEKNVLKDIFENFEESEKREMINESLGLTGSLRPNLKVKDDMSKLEKKVESFFQREDVSRPTAGKKETIPRHGQKVQKRFLLDTMINLYKAFKQENPDVKCSYYYFTKKKPFYVVKPSVSGREMCLCKTHTNPTYKANALKKKGIITTENMRELIDVIVCNPKDQNCMYGTCKKCYHLKIQSNVDKDSDKVQWKEWVRVQEIYEKDGKTSKAFKNVKQDKEGTVKEMLDAFNEELKILKKHVYNIKSQFINFRQAIDKLTRTEAVVVANFSENYNCKHHEEIQAHHFGGSRLQVSLHTVVVYVHTHDGKKIESFCTVSPNTNHQPAAIWAHFDPVLKDIRDMFPDICVIHFFTDGPFTQYRQKQNFYLASTALFDYGFKAMTWSFFEAGHGKGPADGIGGFLKRTADDLVARGEDISCADKFYAVMKNLSKIKLHLISSSNIEDISKQIPPKIQPLPGTKDVHQIFSICRGELKYRHLSCFCTRGFCECLSPKKYMPLPVVAETKIPTLTAKHNTDNTREENAELHENVPELIAYVEENGSNMSISPSLKFVDDPINSDEDLPLSNYKVSRQKSPLKEIGLLDLSKPRNKSWYRNIYKTPETSDDEQQQGTSRQISADKENRQVQQGVFMLVNVHATKGKILKYVRIVDDLHEDGEIRVTFLRTVKNKNTFRLDKNDVADIDYTDILEILPEPTILSKRGQQYYVFQSDVDVFEK